MSGFSSKTPPSLDNVRLEDLLPVYDFADNSGKTVHFRLFGNIISYEYIWFYIMSKTKGKVKVPVLCTDLNPFTDKYVADDCPFRQDGRGQVSRIYLINAIHRERQDREPKKIPPLTQREKDFVSSPYFDAYKPFNFDGKMRFINKDSSAWTPFVPLRLTASHARQIAEIETNNIVDGEKYDSNHIEFGFDISFKFTKGVGGGPSKMIITADPEKDATEITDEELEFPVYNLDVMKYPRLADVKARYKEFSKRIVDAPEEVQKGGAVARGRLEEDEEEDDVRHSSRRNARGNTDKLGSGRRGYVEDEDSEVPY